MNPKTHRFRAGVAAATVGAGATVAALLLAPAISGAVESPSALVATDEPIDTTEDTTDDTGAADESGANTDGPDIDAPGGPGGPGFPGRPDGGPGHGRWRIFNGDVIAGAIGIDLETLRQELRDGSTIAEIAEANGVDPQAVIDALVADYSERVTEWIDGEPPTTDEAPAAGADTTVTTTA